MAGPYIKILKSSANFTNVFRGAFESSQMVAFSSWPV